MKREILVAGFGGQGVLSIGKTLAEGGLRENKNVSWVPSYGPEMRGGTANCSVIISDNPIGSPVVFSPTELIAMNEPSLRKFEDKVTKGGSIFLNSSIVKGAIKRTDVNVYTISCDNIAEDLNNSKVSNMVMLGAFIAETGMLKIETLYKMMEGMFSGVKSKLLSINMSAVMRGIKSVTLSFEKESVQRKL